MFPRKSRFYLALLGVMALGAVVRFWGLDLCLYEYDQAEALSRAIDFGINHRFPLRGSTASIGMANPPAAVWVMALGAAIRPTVLFVTGFIAFLNVLAIGITGLAGRKLAGPRAGLLAAALLALSPWAVMHSRFIWNQNLLPFFPSLILYCSFHWLAKPSRWTLAALIILGSLIAQIHVSAQAILPVPLLALAFGWRRYGDAFGRKLATVAISGAIAVALWVPYRINNARELHDRAYKRAWESATWMEHGPKVPQHYRPGIKDDNVGLLFSSPLAMTLQVHSADFLEYWVGCFQDTMHVHRRLWRTYGLVASLAVIAAWVTASGVWSRKWWPRSPRRQMAVLAALWLVLPALGLCLVRQLAFPHYFVICLPAGFLLMARQAALRRPWVYPVLICLAFSAVLLFCLGLDLQSQGGFPDGNYGMGFARIEAMALNHQP